MNIGDRVRRARLRQGLTQLKLAAMSDLSLGTVSNIERGADIDTSDMTLYKLGKALGEDFTDRQQESA